MNIKIYQIIFIITFVYISVYLSSSYTPGIITDYSGWSSWFDQSEYLKSSFALLNLDLTPENFFYPPLYPALGSLFLPIFKIHSYFPINLFCLLWFTFVFIRVSELYTTRWWTIFLLFSSLALNITVFENFIIPWTTTLSAALISTGVIGIVWLQETFSNKKLKVGSWKTFIVALSIGLLIPTRPIDAAVGAIIGIAFFISYLNILKALPERVLPLRKFLIISICSVSVGPILFFLFNKFVFGNVLGSYIHVASSNGIFPSDLAEKFISIWLDAKILYGNSSISITEKFPWLIISIAGFVWAGLCGNFLLRSLAAAIAGMLILYLPYGDLLPNGLWQYFNIHYFKWIFPYFALFAWVLLNKAYQGFVDKSKFIFPVSTLVIISTFMLAIQIVPQVKPLEVSLIDRRINMTLPSEEIDFIDFKGIKGKFEDIYFGKHNVLIDEFELKRERDFRLIPQGSDIRLLFIRPVHGKNLKFSPDTNLVIYNSELLSQIGKYKIQFGQIRPLRNKPKSDLAKDYRPNEIIYFSKGNTSIFYAIDNFSDPEDSGTWTLNDYAMIRMRLINFDLNKATNVNITYRSIVGDKQKCQHLLVKANNIKIGSESLCFGANNYGVYNYRIPGDLVKNNQILELSFVTPDSVSPSSLNINNDLRKLGINIKELILSQ